MNAKTKNKRHLLRHLAAGEIDLCELARSHGLSLLQMAAWTQRPHVDAAIVLIERFIERRTALLLADARAQAAESLRRMATGDSPKETARRACIDLLKLAPARESSGRRVEPDDEADLSGDGAAADLNRLMNSMQPDSASPPVPGAAPARVA